MSAALLTPMVNTLVYRIVPLLTVVFTLQLFVKSCLGADFSAHEEFAFDATWKVYAFIIGLTWFLWGKEEHAKVVERLEALEDYLWR